MNEKNGKHLAGSSHDAKDALPCNFVGGIANNHKKLSHASHYTGSNLNMESPKEMSIAITNICTFLGVTTYPSQEKQAY